MTEELRQLTDEEVTTLSKLANDSSLTARGFLKRFIVRNTYTPKYKVGDYLKVTDYSSKIGGKQVVDVNFKVEEVRWMIGSGIEYEHICVLYTGHAKDDEGNSYFVCAEEYVFNVSHPSRFISGKSDTDINHFKPNGPTCINL